MRLFCALVFIFHVKNQRQSRSGIISMDQAVGIRGIRKVSIRKESIRKESIRKGIRKESSSGN